MVEVNPRECPESGASGAVCLGLRLTKAMMGRSVRVLTECPYSGTSLREWVTRVEGALDDSTALREPEAAFGFGQRRHRQLAWELLRLERVSQDRCSKPIRVTSIDMTSSMR